MQADTFGWGHMKGRKVFPVTIAKSQTLSTVRPPNMQYGAINYPYLSRHLFENKWSQQWHWWQFGWPWDLKADLILRTQSKGRGCSWKWWKLQWKRWYQRWWQQPWKGGSVGDLGKTVCVQCWGNWLNRYWMQWHNEKDNDHKGDDENHSCVSVWYSQFHVIDLGVETVCVQCWGKRPDGRTLLKSKLPLLILHQYTLPPWPSKSVQCSTLNVQWLMFYVQTCPMFMFLFNFLKNIDIPIFLNDGRNSSVRISN